MGKQELDIKVYPNVSDSIILKKKIMPLYIPDIYKKKL